MTTPQAKSIWQEIRPHTLNLAVTREECVQPNLTAPSYCPDNREEFWMIYQKHGIQYAGKYIGLLPASGLEKFNIKVRRKLVRLFGKGTSFKPKNEFSGSVDQTV